MRVGADHAGLDRYGGRAAQAHVLADGRDRIGDRLGHRLAGRGDDGRAERVEVATRVDGQVGDLADERLELIVAGDEIGLGIDLDECRRSALRGDADEAFGSRAAGLLRRLRQALLAQPVDRGLHVAGGLGQSRLAIHHACAGNVAKLFNLAS